LSGAPPSRKIGILGIPREEVYSEVADFKRTCRG
jgi:hypothetical protein